MKAEGFDRAARVGDQIQRELASIIARELDDPRVRGVTVSGVSVSRDLRHARVYVTPPDKELALLDRPALDRSVGTAAAPARHCVGTDTSSARDSASIERDRVDILLKALRRAAPLLRKRLGQQVRLRFVPRLEFVYDATLDTANHLDALLREAAIEPSPKSSDQKSSDQKSSDQNQHDRAHDQPHHHTAETEQPDDRRPHTPAGGDKHSRSHG